MDRYYACRLGSVWEMKSASSALAAFKKAFGHALLGDRFANEVRPLDGSTFRAAQDEFFRLQLAELVRSSKKAGKKPAVMTEIIAREVSSLSDTVAE